MLHLSYVQVHFVCRLNISRFEIHTAVNCVICFANSSNVENHLLNDECQCCALHDHKIFKIWTFRPVYDKACVNDAIFHVTVAL